MTPYHYLHALNTIPQIGSQALRKLLEYFDTPEAIWNASSNGLYASGINEKTVESILERRPRIDIRQEWERLEAEGIRILLEEDADYPRLLKEIHQPPFILYKKGSFKINHKPLIAIVGSRHPSPYGKRVAETFAKELAQAGVGVVSGLAFGIDSCAHTGTLDIESGTIAVLGNGLDQASISPKSQLPLARAILDRGGALLSEYPPGTKATPYTFPARNRIISGISLGTIVVEAALKSGSLITARYAIEQNREVFAVPGSVFSEASAGPHELIRSGAKLAGNIRDILEEIRPAESVSEAPREPATPLSPSETAILKTLSSEPLHIDKILKATTLETSQVQSALAFLEIKGLIRNIGGMYYIRI